MYDVTVTNKYIYGIMPPEVRGEPPRPPNAGIMPLGQGQKAEFKNWGSASMDVPGMGRINFIDLGNRKLDAYTNERLPWTKLTWGGLIRYRGLDAYFRYEGQGKVEVVVDQVGSISLRFLQGGMMVNLDDLTVR
jgi:hypothetical protein